MKVLIDIGHPAHVHYFRNMIKIMSEKGCQFIVVARDKEVTHDLLEHYKIPFFSRGKGGNTTISRVLYLCKSILLIYRIAKKFRPDLFISFASSPAAIASALCGKCHIVFDDTEHNHLNHKVYVPFSDEIYSPSSFLKDFGKKHKKFNSFMELAYLHPNYFKPDPTIYNLLKLPLGEKFVILRFISWNAQHDMGQKGLSTKIKLRAIREFSKLARVLISAEGELPKELEKYRIKISPDKIHQVLYHATLYFGESGTMATESSILGTPAVRVSSLAKLLGNFKELNEKYHLIEYFDSDEEGFDRAYELLLDNNSKNEWRKKAEALLHDKEDITKLMINIINKRLNHG